MKYDLFPTVTWAACTSGYEVAFIPNTKTLNYGSIMRLYVREYGRDPEDETISINASIVGPANIDFDGMYTIR